MDTVIPFELQLVSISFSIAEVVAGFIAEVVLVSISFSIAEGVLLTEEWCPIFLYCSLRIL